MQVQAASQLLIDEHYYLRFVMNRRVKIIFTLT